MAKRGSNPQPISSKAVVANKPTGPVAKALGKDFIVEVRQRSEKFDPRSFRTIWLGKGTVKAAAVIGCPKGKWNAKTGRCRVGTQTVKRWLPAKRAKELSRSRKHRRVANPKKLSPRELEQFAGRHLEENPPLVVFWPNPAQAKCSRCGVPVSAENSVSYQRKLVCNACYRGTTAQNPREIPASLRRYAKEPHFQEAIDRYVKLHGCMPTSVTVKQLPLAGTGRQWFVALGTAPAESYEPTVGQEKAGSSKRGRIWVHPYESKPFKIVDLTGRLIMTTPGSHRVTDFIRG